MRRTSQEAEKTRERIFRAGLKVFGDRGYSATRLEDIAREAGTTRGAIYWHFRNKEGFFDEIYRRVHARVEEAFERGAPGESAIEALRSTMVTMLRDFVGNDEWRLMCSLLVKTSWVEPVQKLRSQIVDRSLKSKAEERIRRWIARGEVRAASHPRLVLEAVKSYMWGLLVMAIDGDVALGRGRAAEMVDLFLRGLAPCGTRRRRGGGHR